MNINNLTASKHETTRC